jgi:hypothetical protein
MKSYHVFDHSSAQRRDYSFGQTKVGRFGGVIETVTGGTQKVIERTPSAVSYSGVGIANSMAGMSARQTSIERGTQGKTSFPLRSKRVNSNSQTRKMEQTTTTSVR